MKVDKNTGLVLYRSDLYNEGPPPTWVVGTYSDTAYCVPGCLDFSTEEYEEFDTLEEALLVFSRLAEAVK